MMKPDLSSQKLQNQVAAKQVMCGGLHGGIGTSSVRRASDPTPYSTVNIHAMR